MKVATSVLISSINIASWFLMATEAPAIISKFKGAEIVRKEII